MNLIHKGVLFFFILSLLITVTNVFNFDGSKQVLAEARCRWEPREIEVGERATFIGEGLAGGVQKTLEIEYTNPNGTREIVFREDIPQGDYQREFNIFDRDGFYDALLIREGGGEGCGTRLTVGEAPPIIITGNCSNPPVFDSFFTGAVGDIKTGDTVTVNYTASGETLSTYVGDWTVQVDDNTSTTRRLTDTFAGPQPPGTRIWSVNIGSFEAGRHFVKLFYRPDVIPPEPTVFCYSLIFRVLPGGQDLTGELSENTRRIVNFLVNFGIGIAGGLAFLLLIYGGFKFIFSMGNPENVQQGREIITAAIIGLLVVVFSVFLLRLIGISILGLPI
ncbi:hypothetical protein IID23_01740 [Patescibacteria group bacterium]|nr:hypothetical protein [Patescibacteria group bacterium]